MSAGLTKAPMHITKISAVAENPLFELQQAIYSSSNYTRRRLHQTRLRWVTRAIAAHAGAIPSSTAVEYGPGSGIYLPVLGQHCTKVTAADIEHAYLSGIEKLVGKLQGLQLVVDDIQDSRFAENSFGLVLCSEVIEHVADPERALKTLYRILQPGGIAIVSTPQRFSLMELSCKLAFLPGVIQLVRRIYREPVLETGHISLRTFGALSTAIRDSGLQILEHQKFGLYIPLLAEFGGDWGGRAIEALERRLSRTVINRLYWTQAYVLLKPRA
jgi:2-polyprenyl-3-methyl-5-hydroxy-6-metoxy-1,4-benzoquinol methylase